MDESLSDVQAGLNAIDIPTADHTRYFEIGNILYSSSGWSYGSSAKRIRTKRGISFHLPAGRKLGLTDYTNARYYVSWKKADGTYDNRGWLREDFIAPIEGDYVLIATAVPEENVANVNDLASLVYGLLDIPESIEKVYESVAKIENGVTMQTEHLGTILSAYPQKYPEFSSANNTLTIFAETMLILRGGANYVKIATVDTVIDLSTVSSQAKKVYYNLTSGTFSVVAYSNPCADDDVLICTIRRTAEKAYVSMSCPFYVNGEPFGFDFKGIVADGVLRSGVNSHIKAICHRGWNTVAPENTIPAYKEAVLHGFKYVETDVMFTSDGVPVLLHDDTINRTARNADGTEISTDIDIETITYADLLQYDFGIWKDTKYTGTKIPKLEDFFVFCRNTGLHPYVEIKATKTYTEAQIQGLVDLAKRCGMKGRMTWISMSLTYLGYIASYDATARLGYVTSGSSPTITGLVSLKTNQNDVFLDSGKAISSSKIEECMDADIPIEIWTTDSVNDIKNFHPYIQGVTSNTQRADKILLEYALDS